LTSEKEIAEAVAALRQGGLVAMPTETVYGLAADARNPDAVRRIFALKGRPADHPVIVHLPVAAELPDWVAQVPPAAQQLIAAFWPGPLTLVLKKAPGVDPVITGGQDTVGVRMPSHPVAQALLRAFGGAVAAPSANRFGRISPTRAEHVKAEFPDTALLVLDGGPSDVGLESTIVDLSSGAPRLLRPGSISASAIAALIGPLRTPTDNEGPRVSGRLQSHYAPATPVRLVAQADLELELARTGPATLWLTPGPLSRGMQGIALDANPALFGRGLYAALRELDVRGGSEILVVLPPQQEAWEAVHDRLRRAAASGQGC
jgi:L-threonylcarbamoyladenylate synthase